MAFSGERGLSSEVESRNFRAKRSSRTQCMVSMLRNRLRSYRGDLGRPGPPKKKTHVLYMRMAVQRAIGKTSHDIHSIDNAPTRTLHCNSTSSKPSDRFRAMRPNSRQVTISPSTSKCWLGAPNHISGTANSGALD